MSDPVNHPPHYNQVPGIECLDVVKHFGFLRGNAIKYLWRADHKNGVEDLKKAAFYVQAEIAEMEAAQSAVPPLEPHQMARTTHTLHIDDDPAVWKNPAVHAAPPRGSVYDDVIVIPDRPRR